MTTRNWKRTEGRGRLVVLQCRSSASSSEKCAFDDVLVPLTVAVAAAVSVCLCRQNSQCQIKWSVKCSESAATSRKKTAALNSTNLLRKRPAKGETAEKTCHLLFFVVSSAHTQHWCCFIYQNEKNSLFWLPPPHVSGQKGWQAAAAATLCSASANDAAHSLTHCTRTHRLIIITMMKHLLQVRGRRWLVRARLGKLYCFAAMYL